ncbi:MAG TPA: HPF/RaiA family ribosome-associated protein [Lacipirellula sp.]
MQIEVTTDNHVDGSEQLSTHVRSVVEDALGRFGNRVTWVEVHLGDENSRKTGGAYCGIHAKLAGADTFNVNAESATIDQALDAATDKLLKVIDRSLGKKEDPKKRSPMHGEPGL